MHLTQCYANAADARKRRGRKWDRKTERCVNCLFWSEGDPGMCEKHATETWYDGGCALHQLNPNYAPSIRVHSKPLRAARVSQNKISSARPVIRKAFDLIRYNPEQRVLRRRFLDFLGGKSSLTDELLADAIGLLASVKD